jgi:pimeloyl-ACP methyl ester carboxylesterase
MHSLVFDGKNWALGETAMSLNIYPPIGKLIDVDGHQLHLYCKGKGDPTVIFEAGGGGWSMDWYLVQTKVSEFTATCSYDRAGFGWSGPGPKPRTSVQMVKELHTLLLKAGVKAPYVFVGASFGGHPVRLYADTYPDEVAGIVLVDARHEATNTRMPPAWQQLEKAGKGFYQVMLLASQLKVLTMLGKLMGDKALPPMAKKLPADMLSMYLAVGFQPKCWQTSLDELAACPESDVQLSAARSLGNIPLTVIRHGIPEMFARMPAGQAEQAEQIWQALQRELANQSSNSHLLVAEKSGHTIQNDQPDFVVDAIRQMVVAARVSGSVARVEL